MKSLYKKIFKQNQIDFGQPYEITTPLIDDIMPMIAELEEEPPEPFDPEEEGNNIVLRAREEADYIIKSAYEEALHIKASAESESLQNRTRIYEEAKQAGFEEGYRQSMEQHRGWVEEAAALQASAKQRYDEALWSLEEDMLNMVLATTRKVVHEELTIHPESIVSLIQQGIQCCTNRDDLIVRVAPQHYDIALDHKEQLMGAVEGLHELQLKSDSSLKPGDCVVETAYGSIHAGIEKKLDKIQQAFFKIVHASTSQLDEVAR